MGGDVRNSPGTSRFEEIRDQGIHRRPIRAELKRIEDRFTPVGETLARNSTGRCGSVRSRVAQRPNHERLGDTPLGMVESALEFVVSREDDFHNFKFSMKSSTRR